MLAPTGCTVTEYHLILFFSSLKLERKGTKFSEYTMIVKS